jgi:hypothetical protein
VGFVSVLIDATVIRAFVVPAVMAFAGRWNWYPGRYRGPSSLEKVACGAFCACPSLDGTLRVDLRSTKRAPARLSDISFVSADKKRGFCQLRSRGNASRTGS